MQQYGFARGLNQQPLDEQANVDATANINNHTNLLQIGA